jgi:RNA polymerase sigma factor (sigma-70 family)
VHAVSRAGGAGAGGAGAEVGQDERGAGVDELFRARRDPSIRLAVFLVGDVTLAEELVQDAFLEVTRRWHELDNPAGYLRTTVVNRCRNHRRRLALVGRRPVPPPPLVTEAPELDELWSVLARLPARRRAAVVLRYYEDLPIAEIARLLGCREGTVSSLLHRGLADLRKVLDDGS